MPFASKNGRNAMFGADARARTLATGKSIWNGASRAWNGAGNIASRTVGGIGNMANRTVSGAKNGLLAAEAKVNNAMDESPVLDWLFPRGGNGPEPAFAGVPNGRTTAPKVDTPETSQPMMMEGNHSNLSGGTHGSSVSSGLPQVTGSTPHPTGSSVGSSPLLPGEARVGTYRELNNAGSVGDNITPHHIPSDRHMGQHGVPKGDGISINMEQPRIGGRHRETFTYGTTADSGMLSRDALAAGVRDARRIYQDHGLYDSYIRQQLLELIRLNKSSYPNIFRK
jgi:hypothetical protein